jgi:aspartate/methionine/tyrosine aminotransferase
MGIYVALQAVVNPGDEVILFDPVYDPYPSVIRMAGGVPVRVPAEVTNGHFAVSPARVEAALTPRSKVMLINNPWNPTGSVMTRHELSALAALAEAHDLVLIADEIYEKIVFDGQAHQPLAALSASARARTITVNSLSKTYAMTGWRIGYNLAQPDLTRAMLRIAEQLSRSAATFIQHAAVTALAGPQDSVAGMQAAYARRRDLVGTLVREAGFAGFVPPEATFFAFLDVRGCGRSSQSLADYLLERARVVVVPGSAYGPAGEGFLRLSFAYDDESLRRGVGAVVQALQEL